MKRWILIFTLFLITNPAFAGSIFTKNEQVQTDTTAPFFINIYAENPLDVNEDFGEPFLNNNQQVQFFNKKTETPPEKDEKLFVSARRSTTVSNKMHQSDTIEISTNYVYGRWDLKGCIMQETLSGSNSYNNSISFEPAFRLNDNFSLFGGFSRSITDNYDQVKFGIKWTPQSIDRFEVKIGVSAYSKQFYNYRNKLNFETIFKI